MRYGVVPDPSARPSLEEREEPPSLSRRPAVLRTSGSTSDERERRRYVLQSVAGAVFRTRVVRALYRHLEGSPRLLAGARGRGLSGEFERLMGQSGPMRQNSLPAGSRSTRVVHSPASARDTDDAPAANISSTRGRA
jgi:hypothetical protein